jgi:hypothetical protein
MRRDVTRADVERYKLLFEKTRRRLGFDIAIETIITAERFGNSGGRIAVEASPAVTEACQQLVSEVARIYGITFTQIRGESEGADIKVVRAARQEACWRLRKTGIRYEDVAGLMAMNVSTAFAAQLAFRARLYRDAMLRRRIGVVRKAAKAKAAIVVGTKPAVRRRSA